MTQTKDQIYHLGGSAAGLETGGRAAELLMKLPDRDGDGEMVLVLVTPSQELESLFEVWTADTGACLRQHLRSLDRARAGEQPGDC